MDNYRNGYWVDEFDVFALFTYGCPMHDEYYHLLITTGKLIFL